MKQYLSWKLFVLVLLFFLPAGCGGRHMKDSASITLAPGEVYEDCLDLTPKQVLTFSYGAEVPVNFNIHYHVGEQVFYPVSNTHSSMWRNGAFQPDKPQYYCLMWTNTSAKEMKMWLEFGFHPVMPHKPMHHKRRMME